MAGWLEKSEEERRGYQEQLEQQIEAVKLLYAYGRGEIEGPFTQPNEGTTSAD